MIGLGMTFGCNIDHRTTNAVHMEAQPHVIVETLDPTLVRYAPLWEKEIGRRFDNAVGILVHGGDFVRGQWIAGTEMQNGHVESMQDVVRRFQKLYPDRTIVLLACNTGHLALNIPGVYYAKSSVWCVPDRDTASPTVAADEMMLKTDGDSAESDGPETVDRWDIDPDAVGSIYEFVTDGN
jgi:hypothetical protein